MTNDEIITSITTVIDKAEMHDAFLLEHNASERAVTHRLAVYIEEQFPGYHVDCEYNLQGDGERKNLSYTSNGIYTDIIVHERGHDRKNLLHIEIKKAIDARGISDDKRRLQSMMTEKGYQAACLIVIEQSSPYFHLIWIYDSVVSQNAANR